MSKEAKKASVEIRKSIRKALGQVTKINDAIEEAIEMEENIETYRGPQKEHFIDKVATALRAWPEDRVEWLLDEVILPFDDPPPSEGPFPVFPFRSTFFSPS